MTILFLIVIAISITFLSTDYQVYNGNTPSPIPLIDHWEQVDFFENITLPHSESLIWIIDPWKGLSDPPLLDHTVPFLLYEQVKGCLTIHFHILP